MNALRRAWLLVAIIVGVSGCGTSGTKEGMVSSASMVAVADLRDSLIGRTVVVEEVRDNGMCGGPIPPPGMVTKIGEGLRIRGELDSFAGETIVLRFPPPATYGRMHIPKANIRSIKILPQENRQHPAPADGVPR